MIVKEPDGRYDLRKSRILLQWKLNDDPATQLFDLEQLKQLNIHVQQISQDKHSAQKPLFFTPYLTVPPPNDDEGYDFHFQRLAEWWCSLPTGNTR